MSTFLFDKIIFGPVRSRRLGVSLGINLLPTTKKVCNFNCIYCECGWTNPSQGERSTFPRREEVRNALDKKLARMKADSHRPDVITFAGNGEPTLHPDFPEIVDDTIELRNKYFPDSKIAVLSNSTTITVPRIREALLKVDHNILKLDSGFDLTVRVHNQPRVNFKVAELISNLKNLKGQLIIQTLFLRGLHNGRTIDNTTPEELEAWLKAIALIRPSEVMIYTISRDTPEGSQLAKVPVSELKRIAAMVNNLGIKTSVSG
ncbi:MAG: radical SAM protein [Bacteroidales bacterium]|jgi:wyosine [tRNA(Phe)-imidazoG37] synthetase (radical SAM superfamily)|nr:radical SAM protein [Bacteroidales bacterium]